VSVVSGLERVIRDPGILRSKGALGLLYNQASIDRNLDCAPDLLYKAFRDRLTVLFGPQHGVHGTEQDNMRETPHSVHPRTGIQITSLYAESRKPSPSVLKSLDAVVVDIQDVGARVYTYATTVAYLMQACAETGQEVVVLDRPNPVNGSDVQGNISRRKFASFVAPFPLPMRHGMTIGELMIFYNKVHDIRCRLTVIPMLGWKRSMWFEATSLPWVMPSPNMPSTETASVYPGQVIFEGTCMSEGRGTTRPFEIIGAPFVDAEAVRKAIPQETLSGAVLRTTEFRPTFNKWSGSICKGFQVHVMDRNVFKPLTASLGILQALMRLYPSGFQWAAPPYEYVFDQLPMDVIMGDDSVRVDLEAGCSIAEIEEKWRDDLMEFKKKREEFLLYS